ncbi:hypothetical protein SAMN05660380_01629 [Xylella fastidiosa]|jgi:hypothetical protein|nr:hypothetical protein SAMN05660380_01629 [Xylella fastidiosa]
MALRDSGAESVCIYIGPGNGLLMNARWLATLPCPAARFGLCPMLLAIVSREMITPS